MTKPTYSAITDTLLVHGNIQKLATDGGRDQFKKCVDMAPSLLPPVHFEH